MLLKVALVWISDFNAAEYSCSSRTLVGVGAFLLGEPHLVSNIPSQRLKSRPPHTAARCREDIPLQPLQGDGWPDSVRWQSPQSLSLLPSLPSRGRPVARRPRLRLPRVDGANRGIHATQRRARCRSPLPSLRFREIQSHRGRRLFRARPEPAGGPAPAHSQAEVCRQRGAHRVADNA